MKKQILIATMSLILLNSCKKETKPITAQPSLKGIAKVKSIGTSTFNSNYFYDGQGRLTTVEHSNATKEKYVYFNNSATHSSYSTTDTLVDTYTLDFNSDGLVVKESYTYPTTIGYYFTYSYNGNNQLFKTVLTNLIKNRIRTENNYYTGKQLDSTQITFSNSTDKYTYIYEYDNTVTNTVSFKNMGLNYLSDGSIYAVKKVTYIFHTSTGTNIQTDNYSYTLDADKRIIQRTINSSSSGTPSITNYTYY